MSSSPPGLDFVAVRELGCGTFSPSRYAARGCLLMRCYGASGDDIASVGGLLTERWLHRRRCQFSPMEPIDAQAENSRKPLNDLSCSLTLFDLIEL